MPATFTNDDSSWSNVKRRYVGGYGNSSVSKTSSLANEDQTCGECGELRPSADGWKATSGDFFCKSCWDKWHTMPAKPSSAWSSSRSSWKTPAGNEYGSKRSKLLLCKTARYGCACCSPAWPTWLPSAEADTKSSDGPGSESPDMSELNGVGYCDAHCHLDIVLQNLKHGGLEWSSKKKMCKWWLSGECPYKEDCDFAHGREDLQPRDALTRQDIEPQLRRYFGNAEGPKLLCVVHNCCELEAIEDTTSILRVANDLGYAVFCTFGCHPHDYREYTEEMETRFLAEIDTCGPRCAVAWGECGLDYWKNYVESKCPTERRRMMDVFARQARISVEHKLPLVVHSRDAEEDTLQVLKDNVPRDHKFHIHAYQGSVSMMMEALDLFPNCVFGVSSMVWCSPGALKVAQHCPLERLVLETDAPYLFEGSDELPRLAHKIAQLHGVKAATVLQQTSIACQRFYGIPES